MADKVILVFNTSHKGYNSGEKAGFTQAEAAELIAKKYARPFQERAVVEKAEAPKGVFARTAAKITRKKKAKKKTSRRGSASDA